MADNTRNRSKKDGECDQASLLNELRALGAKMDHMEIKIDNMQATMQTQMDVKINELRGSLQTLISYGQAAFKCELEKAIQEMRQNLDLEVSIMSSRMEDIELKMGKNQVRGKPFDPDVSLVIVGLPHTEEEDVQAKVRHLLGEGMRCDPVPKLVAVERMRARGPKPGLVRVELETVQDKVAVLRRKAKLKDSDSYGRVFVSSAKSYAERLMEINLRTLISEIPAAKGYFVAGNGRLVKRTGDAVGRGPRV